MRKSVTDQYSDALASPMRQIETLKIDLLGTNSSLLRITKVRINYLGDETRTIEKQLVDNVVLQFPLNEIETFPSTSGGQNISNSINLWDILPIKAYIKYDSSYSTTASTIKRGDIFIRVIFDDNNNKIPMVLRVEKVISSFLGYRKVRDRLELSMVRGWDTGEEEIKKVIDDYVATFGVPSVVYVSPINTYSGVVNNPSIQFNIAMESSSVLPSGIVVSGVTQGILTNSVSFSWQTTSGVVLSGLTPDIYRIYVTNTLVSTFQIPMTSDFSWGFTFI